MSIFKKTYRYNDHTIYNGHHLVTYKGVPAIKCPFDYTIYQMILWEVQPDLVIEIGTNKGGTTLYLADLLEANNKGEVHTIDLPENNESPLLRSHKRIKMFKTGFENYDTTAIKNYKTVLVIEDGSHQYADTLKALQKFSSSVTAGSYFIVEDGIIDNLGWKNKFNGGPQKAINEFLKNDKSFNIDTKWTNFFGKNATFNIKGYLKKSDDGT